MGTIADIAGTLQEGFKINNRTSIRAGDERPDNIVGINGDIYLQTTGSLWLKSNNNWEPIYGATSGLPAPEGNGGLLIRQRLDETGLEYWTETSNLTRRNINENISGSWTFEQQINGTAYRALWGDIAEHYESDKEYPKGTLIKFGGEKEITIADKICNAVITSEPGFILNSEMENGQAIALVGRVPVRVKGKVDKFDDICLSKEPGIGISVNKLDDIDFDFIQSLQIVGKALESKDTKEEGLVLCVVQLKI